NTRFAKSKPIVLASDTDASCSMVTDTTILAHQGRRGGVHPITARLTGGRYLTGSEWRLWVDCGPSCIVRHLQQWVVNGPSPAIRAAARRPRKSTPSGLNDPLHGRRRRPVAIPPCKQPEYGSQLYFFENHA